MTALDTMAVGTVEGHQPLSEPRWDIVLRAVLLCTASFGGLSFSET